VCYSVDRPARTPSIAVATKEEQQIRVRTEFVVERGRTRVERDRTRVGEFWFVSIELVALNRPCHPVYIGWGCLALVGFVKSIFGSLNQTRSVHTALTGRQNWSDQCESVQKSKNFQIT
jgi:hypothetical protein